MTMTDVAVAEAFLGVLATAAKTGDHEALYPMLTADIEWVTPYRTIVGIDNIRQDLTWLHPPDRLDIEFGSVESEDVGDGRIVSKAWETYRVEATGEQAYVRLCTIELVVRGGRVSRYERRSH
jgi:hypothetical protein